MTVRPSYVFVVEVPPSFGVVPPSDTPLEEPEEPPEDPPEEPPLEEPEPPELPPEDPPEDPPLEEPVLPSPPASPSVVEAGDELPQPDAGKARRRHPRRRAVRMG
jgi:hypothetical protein